MYQIDHVATTIAPWQQNEIVATYPVFIEDNKPPYEICCYFIGITTQGYYLVQDFFLNTNIRFTEPFIIIKQEYITFDKHDLLEIFPIIFQADYVEYYLTGEKYTDIRIAGEDQLMHTSYYPSGQKYSRNRYYQGKRNGIMTKWYSNGKKEREGELKNSQQVGFWYTWHKNGQLASSMFYKNGQSYGIYQDWHKNGKRWRRWACYQNKRIGTMYIWDEKGTIKETIPYNS